jgi:hypothetical protein
LSFGGAPFVVLLRIVAYAGHTGKINARLRHHSAYAVERDKREGEGTVRTDEISVQAMRDKGLEPEADRKTRTDSNRRILVSLQDLVKATVVEKVGDGAG